MRRLFVASALVAALTSSACAADLDWVGPSGSNWDTGSNWSSGNEPTSADNAFFGSFETAVVSSSGNEVNNLQLAPSVGGSSSGLTITGDLTVGGNMTAGLSVSLSGSGTLNVTGSSTFRTGSISGSGTYNFSGGVAYTANSFTVGNGTSVVAGGATTFSDATMDHFIGGDWTNNGSYTRSAGSLNLQDAGGVGSFTNVGSFVKTGNGGFVIERGASGVTDSAFTNSGTLSVREGTLTMSSGIDFSNSGDIVLGVLNGTSGTLTINGDFTNTGSVQLFENSVLNTSGSIDFVGTELGGEGSVQQSVTVDGGIVNPGNSPGQLNLLNNLTLNNATLNIELDGDSQGITYDFLNVSGDVTANGLNTVNVALGYTPVEGQTFDIMAWGGTGPADLANFDFSYTGLGGGMFTESISGSNLRLTFSAVPEPGSLTLLGLAGIGLSFVRRRKS